jgi:hypothetical protein
MPPNARLELDIPVHTMCFAKTKQSVGPPVTWYNKPNIGSDENTRYVELMQKFSTTEDDEDTYTVVC